MPPNTKATNSGIITAKKHGNMKNHKRVGSGLCGRWLTAYGPILFATGLTILAVALLLQRGQSALFSGISRALWVNDLAISLINFNDHMVWYGWMMMAANKVLGQEHQALALSSLSKLLHGAPAGESPLGIAVEPLDPEDPLSYIITQDACSGDAFWQKNCRTAYDGVAAEGGVMQAVLRLHSIGWQCAEAVNAAGLALNANPSPTAAEQAAYAELTQCLPRVVLLEKHLTRDALNRLQVQLLHDVEEIVERTTRELISYWAAAFCVAILGSVAAAIFTLRTQRNMAATRWLLLQMPQTAWQGARDRAGQKSPYMQFVYWMERSASEASIN